MKEKKVLLKIYIASLFFLVLLLLLQCSKDYSTTPDDGVSDITLTITIAENSIGAIEATTTPKAAAITNVVVTVSGHDMDTISRSLTESGDTYSGSIEVPKGTARTFAVEAKDGSDIVQYEGSVTQDIQDDAMVSITLTPLYPNAVSLSITDATAYSVSLSWTQNNDNDFDHYVILRNTINALDLNNSAHRLIQINSKYTTSHEDDTVVPNTTYYYQVWVVDTESLARGSNLASITTESGVQMIHLSYDDEIVESSNYSWDAEDGFFVKFTSPVYPCYIDSLHFYLIDYSGEQDNFSVVVRNSSNNIIFRSVPIQTSAGEGWVSGNIVWNTPQDGTVYDDFYAGFVYEKNNGWPEIGVDMDYPSYQRSYYYNYYYNTMYLIDTYGGTDPGNLDVGNMLIHATVRIGGRLLKLSSDGTHSFIGDPHAPQQNSNAAKVVVDGEGRERVLKHNKMNKKPKRNQ